MTDRGARHFNPPVRPGELSWKSRETMRMLSEGLADQLIAYTLGVPLAAIEELVLEAFDHYGVDSREAAIAAWRRERSLRARLQGAARSFASPKGVGFATLAAVLMVGWAAAFRYVDLEPGLEYPADVLTTDEYQATIFAGSRPISPRQTPVPTATLPAYVRPAPGIRLADGPPLFPDFELKAEIPVSPAPTQNIDVAAPPASVFAPGKIDDDVLYDTVTGTSISLGPGSNIATFTFDSEWVIYGIRKTSNGLPVGPNDTHLRHLSTGQERIFTDTTGQAFSWDSLRIGIARKDTGSGWVWYDIATGEISEIQGPSAFPVPAGRARVAFPGGAYYLEGASGGAPRRPDFTKGTRVSVVETATNRIVLEFDVITAEPAGPYEVAVVTPALSSEPYAPVNILLIDVRTAEVSYITTARTPFRTLLSMPLSATEDHIAWTDALCKADGYINVLNRATGEISVLIDSHTAPEHRTPWLDARGRMIVRSRVPGAVFDLRSMSYVYQLPPHPNPKVQPKAKWSPDGRYAAEGGFTWESLCPAP